MSIGGVGDWLDDSTYDGATLPLGIPDWPLPIEEEEEVSNSSSSSNASNTSYSSSSGDNSYEDNGMMRRRLLGVGSNVVRGAALFDFGPHSHHYQEGSSQGEGWLGAHSGRPDSSRCGSCDVVQGAWETGLEAGSGNLKKSSCLYDGLDPTCASSYCGVAG